MFTAVVMNTMKAMDNEYMTMVFLQHGNTSPPHAASHTRGAPTGRTDCGLGVLRDWRSSTAASQGAPKTACHTCASMHMRISKVVMGAR